MKKIVCIILIYLTFCFLTPLPFANAQKGEEVFLTKCGTCHGKGGKAPNLSPVKFASTQWKRFFEKNKHARRTDISDVVSVPEIIAVKVYLMEHAADSDLPIATGTR
ncbi:MAG: cytochrome c [Thermodesulfobacteriota bacterium]|nr:cytochrome c [Thermodesulfobacteriota bacterium]